MSLYWKIFLSFSIAMILTLVGAVFVSFRLAEQAFDQDRAENRSVFIEEAAAALDSNGEEGLTNWLSRNRRPTQRTLLWIIDNNGRELLGQPIPPPMVRAITQPEIRPPDSPSNYRPRRIAPRLIAPDGSEYYLVFTRPPRTLFGVLSWPNTQVAVLSLAAAVAAVTALLLARYIASPIVQLQRAARSLAAGKLGTRVGQPFDRRHDEVGTLARDFDKMAEQIQQLVVAKETLMRDVSHELRSPLARIRVALALAERDASSTALPAQLQRIENETERLDQLVGQVLTLTRLRTQAPHDHKPIDLNEMLSEIIDNAKYENATTEIAFSPNKHATVMGNLEELRSALENTVRNALAYANDPGKVEIVLETSGDAVTIRVADNGPGVPEKDLTKIFEPFYRTDQSRDHQRKGEGIGLAITSSVVDRHAGTVTARNRSTGGLEISMRLPRTSAAS